MARSRVNGQKFEDDIKKAAGKSPFPIYALRLRTPQSQQAGVRNIADFILFGKRVVILEAKETKEKSFSLRASDFQQKDEIEKYKDEFFTKASPYYGFDKGHPYRLAVLVHFIKEKKYTFYYLDENPFVVMHPDDPNCVTCSTLQEVFEYLMLGED